MDKNLQRDLICFLYFDLNRLRYIIGDEIFEYDIQANIHQFLKYRLKNKNTIVQREREGKVDIVIVSKNDEGIVHNYTFIEVKSFIKKSEIFDYNKIHDDIKKLSDKISERDKISDGYLIVAVKQSHFLNTDKVFKSLLKALSGKKKSYEFEYGKEREKIKAGIIRSFITYYSGKSDNEGHKSEVHKAQIRLFMFHLK